MNLPADKGRVTVVMNKNDYYEKYNKLLRDEKTYPQMKSDPIKKFKKEFVSNLRDLKDKIDQPCITYETLYPTVDQTSRCYGLPKIHKNIMP